MHAQMDFADPLQHRFGLVVPIESRQGKTPALATDCQARPSHVLVFEGRSFTPIAGWRLNKTTAGYAQFVGTHAQAKRNSSSGRLLLVSQDRDLVTFSVDSDDLIDDKDYADEGNTVETSGPLATSGNPTSALESVFGKTANARKEVDPGVSGKEIEVLTLNKVCWTIVYMDPFICIAHNTTMCKRSYMRTLIVLTAQRRCGGYVC